jgi:hypothetical protein
MGLFEDPDFIWTGFNLAVLLYVLYDIYQELANIFVYMARAGQREGLHITFVNRWASRVYFILLLSSAGLIFVIKNMDSLNAVMLIAPVALLIGFFIHALTNKICFINTVGMGLVMSNFDLEISWDEIREYQWKENVLCLTLNRKWFTRKKIKFSDSTAIVTINELLRSQMQGDKNAAPDVA